MSNTSLWSDHLLSAVLQGSSDSTSAASLSSMLLLSLLGSPWAHAAACSGIVGLSGLFPLLIIGKTGHHTQRLLLSFACGGLLGDVFLHLLPEAYNALENEADGSGRSHHHHHNNEKHLKLGLWVLLGILTFVVVEMLMSHSERVRSVGSQSSQLVAGYLNLLANCVDNFAHGLAVGGAFLVSHKTGLVTTACILCHEIPHEIGDFAILMNAGFSVVDAARAQLATALLGVAGAMAALALDALGGGAIGGVNQLTAWIVPFTCGGFLNISLVNVLPDLIKKSDGTVTDTVSVIGGITAGILAMLTVSQF